jgi:hypothetical protein
MASKPKPPSPVAGRWRIVSMEQWDQDYVDEEEGYFEFNDRRWGDFHFGYVHGQMDCRLTRDGGPALGWSWDGNAEMDAVQGQGWSALEGDELHGMIFHGGNDSRSVAKRAVAPGHGKRKKRGD